MRSISPWFGAALVFALCVFCVLPAVAQESGKWSVGGSVSLNQPIGTFKYYSGTTAKYGLNFSYVVSPRVSVEFEYQRTKDENAGLEGAEFIWFIDSKRYVDPDVSHEIDWNIFSFNAIVRMGDRPMLIAEQWNPYITVGAGFYRYDSFVQNLIWPGQAVAVTGASSLDPTGAAGPDNSVSLPATHDRRAAFTLNGGIGLEAFIISNVSIDIRARYHLSIGDLRPFNDFGLFQTFPLQQFDIGGGFKFYFMGG